MKDPPIQGSIPKKYLQIMTNSLESLTNLNLDYFWIDEIGIKTICNALKGNKCVKTLSLRYCRMGDKGVIEIAKMIKENDTLENINLEGNAITNVGAKAIADVLTCSSLISLNLKHNGITEKGIGVIARTLKTNKTLEHLDLENNCVGDIGSKEIGYMLDINTFLKSLNLTTTHIQEIGAEAILLALENNSSLKTLYLKDNPVMISISIQDEIINALEKNKSITDLYIAFWEDKNISRLQSILQRNRKIDLTILLFLIRKHKRVQGLWQGIPKGILDMVVTRAIQN